MNERDNSLLLDYWKEFYGEEIRKRELIILKLKLALNFYTDTENNWFSAGIEGNHRDNTFADMGTTAKKALKEIGEIYGSEKS